MYAVLAYNLPSQSLPALLPTRMLCWWGYLGVDAVHAWPLLGGASASPELLLLADPGCMHLQAACLHLLCYST